MSVDTHIKLVPRNDWGAAPPEGKMGKLKLPVDTVFFTYTNTSQCSSGSATIPNCAKIIKEIQQTAMYEKGLADIPYNFLLGGDGCVYEGRGWKNKPEEIPQEPELKGKDTLVIAYIGKEEDELPKYRRKSLKKVEDSFLQLGVNSDYITEEADVFYAEPSKYPEAVPEVVPEAVPEVVPKVVSKVVPGAVKKEETSVKPFEEMPSENEEENPFDTFL